MIEKGIKENIPVEMVIYGTEGIGKSTLASNTPKPLFIDLEGGSNQLDVMRMSERPKDWSEFLEQIKFVRDNPDVCDTLVIDTADAAENLAIDFVLTTNHLETLNSSYAKGSNLLYEEFIKLTKLLDEVRDKRINIVVISHARMRKVELPEETGSYDRYELKLQNKTAPILKEWCDCQLFLNYKTIVEKVNDTYKAYGGERVMYTTHRTTWDAKNRYGLEDELPLDYKYIEKLFLKKSPDFEYDFDKSLDENVAAAEKANKEHDLAVQESMIETPPFLVLREAASLNGIEEKTMVDYLMYKCKFQKLHNAKLDDEITLENLEQEDLKKRILPKLDSFLKAVKDYQEKEYNV